MDQAILVNRPPGRAPKMCLKFLVFYFQHSGPGNLFYFPPFQVVTLFATTVQLLGIMEFHHHFLRSYIRWTPKNSNFLLSRHSR